MRLGRRGHGARRRARRRSASQPRKRTRDQPPCIAQARAPADVRRLRTAVPRSATRPRMPLAGDDDAMLRWPRPRPAPKGAAPDCRWRERASSCSRSPSRLLRPVLPGAGARLGRGGHRARRWCCTCVAPAWAERSSTSFDRDLVRLLVDAATQRAPAPVRARDRACGCSRRRHCVAERHAVVAAENGQHQQARASYRAALREYGKSRAAARAARLCARVLRDGGRRRGDPRVPRAAGPGRHAAGRAPQPRPRPGAARRARCARRSS